MDCRRVIENQGEFLKNFRIKKPKVVSTVYYYGDFKIVGAYRNAGNVLYTLL